MKISINFLKKRKKKEQQQPSILCDWNPHDMQI